MRRVDRRTFLGAALALSSAGLAGCAGRIEAAAPTRSKRLSILNWPDYIDPESPGDAGTVQRFEEATGLDVNYVATYEDNVTAYEDLFVPRLEAGRRVGYDIVVPTFWLAARLGELDWLDPIPLELVPNHVNIDPAFLTMSWDRGARYHMPWQAGITGIAWNPALTGRSINSISDLFDPEFRGRVGLVNEMRETLGMVMLLDGNDPARPTREAADLALDQVAAAQTDGQIAAFTYGEFRDLLADGSLALCLAWSGDTFQLQQERPDIQFVVPEEGAMQWFDTMIIPRGAANAAGAGDWMNYVYDPDNAVRITEYVQYISPVLGVQERMLAAGGEPARLAQSPLLFPDAAVRQRLFTWGGLPAEAEDSLEARFAQIAGG